MTSVTEAKPMTTDGGAETVPTPTRGERPAEPLIFEKSVPGHRAVDLPPLDVPRADLPDELMGAPVELPEVGQHDVMVHYTHLSHRNYSVDGNFYPLGSCTMKHNPRINEWAAALPGFGQLHPMLDDAQIQGALRQRGRPESLFGVRRYSPGQLRAIFEACIGASQMGVDGFFTLNPQTTDLDLLPARNRLVVRVSEALRKLSAIIPGFWRLADSLTIRSRPRRSGSRRDSHGC